MKNLFLGSFLLCTTLIAAEAHQSGHTHDDRVHKEHSADPLKANPVSVTLDPFTLRSIGGISQFNRKQFITIHEAFGSVDMNNEDIRFLEDELEVEYGRDGGMITWLADMTKADPENPDMPDINDLKKHQQVFIEDSTTLRLNPENVRETILTMHPEYLHALPNNTFTEWGPRSYETAAEFIAQYLNLWDSQSKPIYLEVMNEPFVHADDIGTTAEAMSEQHNVVAKRVKEINPEVLVGGYTAAWVEVEARNFEHWNNWQKTFMDIAGENMDFFSYHIYDGINVTGEARNRTGSNSEAIIDLIDQYSYLSYGFAKPQMISEFGLIPKGNMGNLTYSAKRSAAMIRSTNAQLLTFMDHPDRLLKVVPFFLGKALWTYGMKEPAVPGKANPFLLWRRLADGETFVTTDLIQYYQFWKGVTGEWRHCQSSDPDVLVHLLAEGNRLQLILMNIELEQRNIQLSGLSQLKANTVRLRSLTTHQDAPVLSENKLSSIPDVLTLAPGESNLLVIDLDQLPRTRNKVEESRVYATSYLKEIEANKAIDFSFEKTPTGKGNATLRISAGRENTRQVLPSSVTFNGHSLTIPTDWAGDEQKGRTMFFGAIEVPVPMSIVKRKNQVNVTYPDSGGKVACVVLQVDKITKN
ncbi:MAG: beta-agarase [Coraliomargaritaceae bacterium]